MATPAQLLARSRFRFPALLPAEILILEAWLRLHESEYDSVDGNVRVGQGSLADFTVDEKTRHMWNDLTRPRIDAVLKRGDKYTIVEVKRNANAHAPIQLLSYRTLWISDNPGAGEPTLILVTDRITADGITVAQRHGVTVHLVNVDFSVLRSQKAKGGGVGPG